MFFFRFLFLIYFFMFSFSFIQNFSKMNGLKNFVSKNISDFIANKMRSIADNIDDSSKNYIFDENKVKKLLTNNKDEWIFIIQNFLNFYYVLNQNSKMGNNTNFSVANTIEIINFLIAKYPKESIVVNPKEIFTISKNVTYELSIKNLLSYKNIPENQRLDKPFSDSIANPIYFFYTSLNKKIREYFTIKNFLISQDADLCNKNDKIPYFGPYYCVLLKGFYADLEANFKKLNSFLSYFYIVNVKERIVLIAKEIKGDLEKSLRMLESEKNSIINNRDNKKNEIEKLIKEACNKKNDFVKQKQEKELKRKDISEESTVIKKKNQNAIDELERNFNIDFLEKEIVLIDEKISQINKELGTQKVKKTVKSRILNNFLGRGADSTDKLKEKLVALHAKKKEIQDDIISRQEQKNRELGLFLNSDEASKVSEDNITKLETAKIDKVYQEQVEIPFSNKTEEYESNLNELNLKVKKIENEINFINSKISLISNNFITQSNTFELIDDNFINENNLVKKINSEIELLNRLKDACEKSDFLNNIINNKTKIDFNSVEKFIKSNSFFKINSFLEGKDKKSDKKEFDLFSKIDSFFKGKDEKSDIEETYKKLLTAVFSINEFYERVSSYLSFFLVFNTYDSTQKEDYVYRLFTFDKELKKNDINSKDIKNRNAINKKSYKYFENLLKYLQNNFIKMKQYFNYNFNK